MERFHVTYKTLHVDPSQDYRLEEALIVVENLWNEIARRAEVLGQEHQALIEVLEVWEEQRCVVCGVWWDRHLLVGGVCRDCR
jgi:hypothetical protein